MAHRWPVERCCLHFSPSQCFFSLFFISSPFTSRFASFFSPSFFLFLLYNCLSCTHASSIHHDSKAPWKVWDTLKIARVCEGERERGNCQMDSCSICWRSREEKSSTWPMCLYHGAAVKVTAEPAAAVAWTVISLQWSKGLYGESFESRCHDEHTGHSEGTESAFTFSFFPPSSSSSLFFASHFVWRTFPSCEMCVSSQSGLQSSPSRDTNKRHRCEGHQWKCKWILWW